jgi:DNA-binding NarL/FixJ family response regulator
MTHVSVCCSTPIESAGIAAVVGEMEGFDLAGTFSGPDVPEEQLQAQSSDVVVLELTPEVTLNAIRRIASCIAPGSLILRVGPEPAEFLSQALESGVKGILGKNSPLTFHTECLREVAAGRVWIDREVSRGLLATSRVSLTPRERQLMELLTRGLRNKEIAWLLGITEGTVKAYLSHLFLKVGVSDRFELALLALRNIAPGAAGVSHRMPAQQGSPAAAASFPGAILRSPAEARII